MNRVQFMEQLKRLLSDVSETERQEALEYYESYFDDAGVENEDRVIRELGSPGKVAAIIKADLKESNDSYAQYTESGYEDSRVDPDVQMPERYSSSDRGERGYHADNRKNRTGIILAIIALVFLSPVLTGALGGVAGVLVTLLLLPFILVAIAAVCAAAMAFGAIACIGSGIALLVTSVPAGILTLGIGCILMAAGILLLVLTVWLAGKVLPALLRKITDLGHNLLQKGRKGGERA